MPIRVARESAGVPQAGNPWPTVQDRVPLVDPDVHEPALAVGVPARHPGLDGGDGDEERLWSASSATSGVKRRPRTAASDGMKATRQVYSSSGVGNTAPCWTAIRTGRGAEPSPCETAAGCVAGTSADRYAPLRINDGAFIYLPPSELASSSVSLLCDNSFRAASGGSPWPLDPFGFTVEHRRYSKTG